MLAALSMTRSALARLPAAVFPLALLSLARPALADEAAGGEAEEEVPADLPRLVLDTGRPEVPRPEPRTIRVLIHGEYQARYEHLRSFPLDPSPTTLQSFPWATGDSLGQTNFLYHWLRVTPRAQINDWLEVVGQLDVLTGVVAGDLAHDTSADQTPRDSYDGFSNVQPRWLYAQLNTNYGVFRVGQQPSYWGIGIVANDGDHPSLFGDYRYGNIVERVLFATKPGGRSSEVSVAVMGDIVYRDNIARITRGDHAAQGIAAVLWEHGPNQLGLYGVYRHQSHDQTSGSDLFPYSDSLNVGVLDVAGKIAMPVPGTDAFLFGVGEVATILGTTNELRTNEQVVAGQTTDIRSYGGAVQLGVVHRAHTDAGGAAKMDKTYGDVVGQVELGYASGDSDPTDGVEHRFTFDPNHKVGLLLFDEVMRFQTARAATAAADPNLANGSRPPPGIGLLPTNGGVAGAEYINPTAIVRPRSWLDLKAGVVVAMATADVVDPYRLAIQGAYVNYRGGNPKRRDLGVEADVGTEGRLPLDLGVTLTLGAQAGVLFPGGALADATGVTMKTPWIFVGRAGLLF